MKHTRKYKKAYALPIAIITGIVLVSLSAALLMSINNEIIINKRSKEKIIVKKLAEAGIEEGLYTYNSKLFREEEIQNFNGEGSIEGIGKYIYSYQTIDEENKIGNIISQAIINGQSKYTILLDFNLENGEIINWQEKN
ncbi:hypothetical protein KQI86_13440 [Clostridium sp. MSJ-11]|uniref:DUF1310 family protein n=1 Tax=Clostridium mobile TaxID=2841512 RepID=A0ABS6EJG3_9CLOT|nr:hypothetical protein [Clostridium mobile]MBU5485341.1 hypothetical protein [Clostridium mobile]